MAELTPVATEAEGKLSTGAHISNSLMWFANNFHWGALLLLILPRDVARFAPGDSKSTWLGIIGGVGAIPALIVPLIAGALSDRSQHPLGRRRPFMAAGVTVNVIGLIFMALIASNASTGSPLIWAYLAAFLVVQIGNNITIGAYMGLIPDVVPSHDRGRASGFMALGTQLGTLIGAIVVGMLFGGAGPLVQYALVASVLTLFAVMTHVQVKEKPNSVTFPKFKLGPYIRSLWIDPRQYPDFAWVWFTRFLVMAGFYSIQPYINYYVADVLGVPQEKVSSVVPVVLGVILIVSSLSAIYGGRLSDKIGRKKVVFTANSILVVGALLFLACRSVPAAIMVGAIFGLGYGAYISVDYALGTDVLPSDTDPGKDMAVWHIAMTLPQSIFMPIAGSLLAMPGATRIPPTNPAEETIIRYTYAGYAIIFVLCAVLFALGALGLRYVRSVR